VVSFYPHYVSCLVRSPKGAVRCGHSLGLLDS
jgi:hypothetical protein